MAKVKSNFVGMPADRANRVIPLDPTAEHKDWAPLAGSGYDKGFPQKQAKDSPGPTTIGRSKANGGNNVT